MPGGRAVILSVGMMTSVGIGARQTAASVRAGICRFRETSIYDKRFQPFKMALLPEEALPPLEPSLETVVGLTARQARMLRLASPALREVLIEAPNPVQVPVFLGTPEAFPDRADPAGEKFLDHLSVQAGLKFNLGQSKMFPNGRAAGLMALKEGLEMITSGRQRYVIVGGVDTYLDLYLLGTLDMEGRILAEGVMDGFIPGEGAGFLLLTADIGRSVVVKPMARVEAAAVGAEKGHRYSEEVYRGDGLAETFQKLFDLISSRNGKIRTVFAGFNGESFGAKEWGVAYLRSKDRFVDRFRFEHPVDCFGDTSAALGPLMIGMATIGMKRGYIEGPCLIWCSSDREERGAVCVRGM
jgi:3-oxoacyl-[acyl-carrier-protein] synthase-1